MHDNDPIHGAFLDGGAKWSLGLGFDVKKMQATDPVWSLQHQLQQATTQEHSTILAKTHLLNIHGI